MIKKLIYYLFNDREYLKSIINYKLKSSNFTLLIIIRYFLNILKKNNKKDALLFVYDLELNPNTFDFGVHLANATIYLREKSLSKIDLLLIKSKSSTPVKSSYLKFISEHEFNNRIFEIIISNFRLSSFANDIFLMKEDNVECIINNYSNIYPLGCSKNKIIACPTKLPDARANKFFPMYNSTPRAKEIIADYLKNFKNKKIITLSFRDWNFIKKRNSRYNDWIKFSEYVKKKNYQIFLIPDPNNYDFEIFKRFKNCHVAEIVLWNLNLRAALYEAAFLNLSIASGIFEIASCYNKDCKSIMFLDFKNGYEKNYIKSLRKTWNFEDTLNQKWLTSNQKYVYKSDSFENIVEAFNQFLHTHKFKNY